MIKNYFQKFFIRFLVKNLFNMIDENDILQIRGNAIMFKGRRLEPERLQKIKDDAEQFAKSTIWQLLSNEVKFEANQRIYTKSQTVDDILAGKITLYILEIIQRKIETISKL